jgi:folate-binding protein YgfZ
MTPAGDAFRKSVLAVRAADRAAIVVRGKDRSTWLNGLVTCDLMKLGHGREREPPPAGAYGLVVEKKGRIQSDFYAAPGTDGESLVLGVLGELRDGLIGTLDHYLVMEDAELELADLVFWLLYGPAARAVAWPAEQAQAPRFGGTLALFGGGVVVAVPAGEAEDYRAHLAARVAAASGVVATDADWEAVRIEEGVPRFGVEADPTLYPQEAGLEKLAVAFDKGCYLGQEVVYMLENRGHVKKKLVPLEIDGAEPLPRGEGVTTTDGAAVGEVKSSLVGSSGKPVAIAMIKWAQAAPGTELRAAGRVVRVRASDRA